MSVTIDTHSSVQTFTGVSSVSWSHTASGTDRFVLVNVAFIGDPSSKTISGVTYGGVSMSAAISSSNPNLGGGQNGISQIWGLINPSTGSQTVQVTFTGTCDGVAGSVSWNGANQTAAIGNTTSATGDSSAPATTISSASGNMVADCFLANYSSGLSPSGNQTVLWTGQERSGVGYTGGSQYAAGASSVAMDWTLTKGEQWSACAVEILVASGGSGVTLAAGTGGFSITGAPADLNTGLMVAAGSIAITGDAAILSIGLNAGVGTFAITGDGSAFSIVLNAAPASFTITGAAASLVVSGNQVLNASPASFTITGGAAEFAANLNAGSASFAITGSAASFNSTFGILPASFTLTGYAASLVVGGNYLLAVQPGNFALTGFAASLVTSSPPPPPPPIISAAGNSLVLAFRRRLIVVRVGRRRRTIRAVDLTPILIRPVIVNNPRLALKGEE